jgi:hypothetical protein
MSAEKIVVKEPLSNFVQPIVLLVFIWIAWWFFFGENYVDKPGLLPVIHTQQPAPQQPAPAVINNGNIINGNNNTIIKDRIVVVEVEKVVERKAPQPTKVETTVVTGPSLVVVNQDGVRTHKVLTNDPLWDVKYAEYIRKTDELEMKFQR